MNETADITFKPWSQTVGSFQAHPRSYTMLSIGVCVEGDKAPTLDGSQVGDIHAVWGDRCLSAKASAFWPKAAALVGIEISGAYSKTRTLMDFDLTESYDADRVVGIHAYVMATPAYTLVREMSLSVGEFWDMLAEAASA